ncbi:hypothetical protein BDV12DRAFT_73895 [Aspergillus spectabilis]
MDETWRIKMSEGHWALSVDGVYSLRTLSSLDDAFLCFLFPVLCFLSRGPLFPLLACAAHPAIGLDDTLPSIVRFDVYISFSPCSCQTSDWPLSLSSSREVLSWSSEKPAAQWRALCLSFESSLCVSLLSLKSAYCAQGLHSLPFLCSGQYIELSSVFCVACLGRVPIISFSSLQPILDGEI